MLLATIRWHKIYVLCFGFVGRYLSFSLCSIGGSWFRTADTAFLTAESVSFILLGDCMSQEPQDDDMELEDDSAVQEVLHLALQR